MTKSELESILGKHRLWLEDGLGGERANLCGANLCGANLSGANLSGADLDYSCLPLWRGGLHIKFDDRIMRQIAYHFCAQDCDSPEYIAARNAIIDYANGFHRVGECGKLEIKIK